MPRKTATTNAYSCCQCHNNFDSLTEFYKTYSTLYTDTGHLPICKDCFLSLFNSYADKYHDRNKAMQRICMAFDLYYDESLFNKCCKEDAVEIGNYMKRLNMVQYQGKTFDTNINEGFVFGEEAVSDNIEKQKKDKPTEKNEQISIKQSDIKRWGQGFEAEDYDMLNSHYNYLKDGNPNSDGNQEIFIKDLCYNNMLKMKALRDGRIEDYNKLSESYRKTFNQSGLKTVKETAGIDDFDLGVTIEMIEKYTPAEYYKNRELYKDFDKIGEYIQRFLYRPLKNLMHGSTERDYEFYVKDNDEVSGVDGDE